MEKITDIFKQFKDRLSNPFIFSFLLSWLIWNWQLPIALFSYKNSDFISYGFSGFIPYAENYLKTRCNNVVPIIAAFIYSFLFPFFRNVVLMAQSFFKSQSSKWNNWASKNGVVGIEKYIAMREAYKNRQEKLAQIISEETTLQERYTLLEGRLNEATISLNEAQGKLDLSAEEKAKMNILLDTLKGETNKLSTDILQGNNRMKKLDESIVALKNSKSPNAFSGKWLMKQKQVNSTYDSEYLVTIINGEIIFADTQTKDSFSEIILLLDLNENNVTLKFSSALKVNGFISFKNMNYYELTLTDDGWGGLTWKGHKNGDTNTVVTFEQRLI